MQARFVELLANVFDFAGLIKRQAGQASRTEVVLVTVPVCVNSAGQIAPACRAEFGSPRRVPLASFQKTDQSLLRFARKWCGPKFAPLCDFSPRGRCQLPPKECHREKSRCCHKQCAVYRPSNL